MVEISVTSPSGTRKFSREFALVEQAQKLLDVLRVHGYEAAEQYAQRTCAQCGADDWRDAIVPDTVEICNCCGASR